MKHERFKNIGNLLSCRFKSRFKFIWIFEFFEFFFLLKSSQGGDIENFPKKRKEKQNALVSDVES
jgi:hypothetical protein